MLMFTTILHQSRQCIASNCFATSIVHSQSSLQQDCEANVILFAAITYLFEYAIALMPRSRFPIMLSLSLTCWRRTDKPEVPSLFKSPRDLHISQAIYSKRQQHKRPRSMVPKFTPYCLLLIASLAHQRYTQRRLKNTHCHSSYCCHCWGSTISHENCTHKILQCIVTFT